MTNLGEANLVRVIAESGWSVDLEVRTLVTLARSDEPRVALPALAAMRRNMATVIDPEVRERFRDRLESCLLPSVPPVEFPLDHKGTPGRAGGGGKQTRNN